MAHSVCRLCNSHNSTLISRRLEIERDCVLPLQYVWLGGFPEAYWEAEQCNVVK